jgi:imidazolonepropionase-like amidohydrolase
VTAIRAARILDPRSGRVFAHATLLVRGETITAVGDAVTTPPGARVLGLIDAHSHLLLTLDPVRDNNDAILRIASTMSTAKRALQGAANAREDVMAGITTVRDLGNSGMSGDLALRDAIASRWIVGPRVVPSTRALAPVGAQFPRLEPDARPLIADEYVTITGVNEARHAVRQAVYDGAECIKIIAEDPTQTLRLDREELHAIVDEAHRAKRKVAAHVESLDGARAVVEAGVDSVEHGYDLSDDVVRTMAAGCARCFSRVKTSRLSYRKTPS